MPKLSQFRIESADDGYLIHIEDDGGVRMDLSVTAEQLDVMADAIDDVLAEDDVDL